MPPFKPVLAALCLSLAATGCVNSARQAQTPSEPPAEAQERIFNLMMAKYIADRCDGFALNAAAFERYDGALAALLRAEGFTYADLDPLAENGVIREFDRFMTARQAQRRPGEAGVAFFCRVAGDDLDARPAVAAMLLRGEAV